MLKIGSCLLMVLYIYIYITFIYVYMEMKIQGLINLIKILDDNC